MRRSLHSLGEQVAKVKKQTGVTGERNAKGKSATRTGRGTGRTAKSNEARSQKARPKKGKPSKGKPTKRRLKKGEEVSARVAVKSLDPLRKCGPNTSVQLLYRVDEQVDGRSTPHLVFFDRHGWYCEHGRTCPAVGHARKFKGQIARVS